MRDSLRIYHRVKEVVRQKVLPNERITRVRNLALLVSGLYRAKSVHLSQIAQQLPVPGKAVSLTNRLRRFLSNTAVEVVRYYEPIARQLLAPFAGQTVRLIIDCTQIGLAYRALTVSLAYRKRALPLAWKVYQGKKGHVDATEQIALLQQVARWLPAGQAVELVGDSGFSSVALLRWLRQQHWQFVLRVRGTLKVYHQGAWRAIEDFALQPGQTRHLGWVRVSQTHDYGWLCLLLHWQQGEDDPWYLLASRPTRSWALRAYRRRVWTEELYGDLKSHGFDVQATHLACPNRIERLLLAVCIVYTAFLTLGAYIVKRGWRHFIDRKDRRDKSFFRLGWDWILRCLRLGAPLPPLLFRPYPN